MEILDMLKNAATDVHNDDDFFSKTSEALQDGLNFLDTAEAAANKKVALSLSKHAANVGNQLQVNASPCHATCISMSKRHMCPINPLAAQTIVSAAALRIAGAEHNPGCSQHDSIQATHAPASPSPRLRQ